MGRIDLDEARPGVLRLTLNDAERLNALSYDMYADLLAKLSACRFDTRTRVIIITGAGRGFCAGNLANQTEAPPWVPKDVGHAQGSLYFAELIRDIPLMIERLPQIVIAAVNGPVAGIGYALMLAADLAVAARSAKFVNAIHVGGTGCEGGMSYLLPRAVGSQKAAEILFTMRTVLADEAERIGLVLKSVPDDMLMVEVLRLADDIMANPPLDNWVTKQALIASRAATSLGAAIDMEARGVSLASATEDSAERRKAAAEARPPVYCAR